MTAPPAPSTSPRRRVAADLLQLLLPVLPVLASLLQLAICSPALAPPAAYDDTPVAGVRGLAAKTDDHVDAQAVSWTGPSASLARDASGQMRIVVDGQMLSPIFLSLNPNGRNWGAWSYEAELATASNVSLIEICLTETNILSGQGYLSEIKSRLGNYSGYLIARVFLGEPDDSFEPTRTQSTLDGSYQDCSAADPSCSPYRFSLSDQWIQNKQQSLRLLLPKLNAAFPGQLAVVRPTYLNGGEWFYVQQAGAKDPETGRPAEWRYADYSSDSETHFCSWPGMPSQLRKRKCRVPDISTRLTPNFGNTLMRGDDGNASRSVYFNRFLAHRVTSAIVALGETIKEASNNQLLTMVFYGYLLTLDFDPASGHNSMQRLLSSPAVDILSGPYSYGESRTLDIGFRPHGPADAAAAWGKMHIHEDDTRTLLYNASSNQSPGNHRMTNLSDTVTMIKRNGLTAALRGNGLYYFDLFGDGWFGQPSRPDESTGMWSAIRSVIKNAAMVNTTEDSAFRPQVVVFVDEVSQSHMTYDNNYGTSAGLPNDDFVDSLLRGAADQLTQLGAPVRLHLLSDLLSSQFDAGSVKLAIFLNAFSLTDTLRAAINNRMKNQNRTLLFFHAAGLLDSDNLSATVAGMSDLIGIPIQEGTGGAISQVTNTTDLCPSCGTYGSTALISPWFHVGSHGGVEAHGRYVANGFTSLASRKFPNHQTVYSGSPSLGLDMWRWVAGSVAGVHLFSNVTGDVVEANGNTLMLFSAATGGVRAVTLATVMAQVVEVTDEREIVVCNSCQMFETPWLAAHKLQLYRWQSQSPKVEQPSNTSTSSQMRAME